MQRIIAAVIKRNNEIMIARRNYGALKGYWEFPGGKVEAGETDEECIRREIREEFLVEIELEKFLGIETFEIQNNPYEMAFYQVKLLNDNIVLTVHSETAWLTKEKLKEYRLAPVDEKFVKKYCQM